MKLLVIVGQRKERYPGEYAPEALDVIDEVGNDENPDYIIEKKKAAEDSGDFEAVVVLAIALDGSRVMELLRPKTVELAGGIQN